MESASANESTTSFGGNQVNNNNSLRPVVAPMKVFTCKYCAKKFLNSRALGGHQNAHKKEKTTWVTAHKSLGMEPHAVVHNPVRVDSPEMESFMKFREAYGQQMFQEAADQDCWPGSFYVQSTSSHESELHTRATEAGKNGERARETEEIREPELLRSTAAELVLSHEPDLANACSLDLDLHL